MDALAIVSLYDGTVLVASVVFLLAESNHLDFILLQVVLYERVERDLLTGSPGEDSIVAYKGACEDNL